MATRSVNNGLHHQEARQEGNGMIAPNHPSVSLSLLPRSSRSICWPSIRLYLLRPALSRSCSASATSQLLLRPTSVQLEEDPHLLHAHRLEDWIWSGSLLAIKGGLQKKLLVKHYVHTLFKTN